MGKERSLKGKLEKKKEVFIMLLYSAVVKNWFTKKLHQCLYKLHLVSQKHHWLLFTAHDDAIVFKENLVFINFNK